jgi:hypothetical protein
MSNIETYLKAELLKKVREFKGLTKGEDEYFKKVIVHELTIPDIVSIFKYGKEFESVSSKNSKMILEIAQKLDSREFLSEAGEIRKGTMSILGLIFYPIHWVIYRLIRAALDKCTGKCGVIAPNLPTRQYCLYKCKLQATEAGLARAKAQKCPPDQQSRCDQIVSSLQAKVDQLKNKVREYESYLAARGKVGREPD